jgi:hypothetical protein
LDIAMNANDLPREKKIGSPNEFAQLLREVKLCLSQGKLRQVKESSMVFSAEDISALPDEGPWPDYVEALFQSADGQRYRLSVETYHGTGGSWQKA